MKDLEGFKRKRKNEEAIQDLEGHFRLSYGEIGENYSFDCRGCSNKERIQKNLRSTVKIKYCFVVMDIKTGLCVS